MTKNHVSRRRVLGTVCGSGAVGLAGCGSFLSSGQEYVCTNIDDEATEPYDEGDHPIPYAFEVPEVMETDEVFSSDNGGRIWFIQRWKDRRGLDTYNHSIDLKVEYRSFQRAVKPMTFRESDPRGSVLGKRTADGHGVGLIQRDDSQSSLRLGLMIPSTADGNQIFGEFEVEASAILQGDQQIRDDVESDDPDQTCFEALRTVAIDVVDSVPVVSAAEEETTLSITPSSATVRRGESVDLTLEASGVGWADLLVEGDGEFEYRGSLAVGDGPTTLRVAPPTDQDSLDAISVAEGEQLDAHDAGGAFSPGTYAVEIRAPGTDGLVRATTSLTVESAG